MKQVQKYWNTSRRPHLRKEDNSEEGNFLRCYAKKYFKHCNKKKRSALESIIYIRNYYTDDERNCQA